MLRHVGYSEESIDEACRYRIALVERDGLAEGVFAPVFASWPIELEERYGLQFPLDEVKQVREKSVTLSN